MRLPYGARRKMMSSITLPRQELVCGATPTCVMYGMPQGGPEWLASRSMSVGGSLISSVLGRSRYKTHRQAVASLVDSPGLPMTDAVALGKAGEGRVRDYVGRMLGIEIREVGIAVHKQCPWARASPDGIYDVPGGGLGVVEIKVASSWSRRGAVARGIERAVGEKSPLLEIPEDHRCQIHYTAGILGAKEILYCVLSLPPEKRSPGKVLVARVPVDTGLFESKMLPAATRAFMEANGEFL